MSTSSERRQFERHEISNVVLFRRQSHRGSYLAGTLRNISEGGALFESLTRLDVGEEIELFFKKKTAYADIRTQARVMHIVEADDVYEVGVEFS